MTVYPDGQVVVAGALEQPLHLAIGMFDGVHVGHQMVMRAAVDASRSDPGSLSGVLTFDPHPSRILRPKQATALLMPFGQRIERMLEVGIKRVFVQAFTLEYAAREAADFADSLQRLFPGLKSLHVGENFRFGAKRSGNVDTLRDTAEAAGIMAGVLVRENYKGRPISSSAIREFLGRGEMKVVNGMLGSPYRIDGTVVPGKKIGRGLGFPTVNIPWCPESPPRYGVYRVTAEWNASGGSLIGIANYGLRPTIEKDSAPLLEVHFLEGSGFPEEGCPVTVHLHEFIRPETKFSSKEALREQIRLDVEAARQSALQDTSDPAGNALF